MVLPLPSNVVANRRLCSYCSVMEGEADIDPRVRPWLCPGDEAIELKLVRSASDIDGPGGFHPEFTHQVVGQRCVARRIGPSYW